MPGTRSGACGLGLCLSLLAGPAGAGTYTVTNTDDTGVGSLRQAILDAINVDPDPDTIVFQLPADSTITLASELAAVSTELTIDATGAPGLNVDGDVKILTVDGGDAAVVDFGVADGAIDLGEDETLTFTANDAFAVNADIADVGGQAGGSLVKDGSAALTLSGDNAGFSGGLAIEAGSVVGNVASLPQSIANDGVLIFDQEADAEYLGAISGTGSVEKQNDGNLRISGTNDYEGTTTVGGGTLTVDEADSLPAGGAVTNDAELVFEQGDAAGEFTGNITGTGNVTKAGSQELRLSGANDYAGTTNVLEGTLIGDSASIPGAVDISSGAILQFDQVANGTHSGAIGGAGALEKTGGGELRLAGANDYAGGTTISGGTLTVDTGSLPPDAVQIDAPGALVFDQGTDGAFGGTLAGGGSLEKRGAATLTLPGSHVVGPTDVTAGTLAVTGMLTSTGLGVGSAGTLAGNGTVAASVGVDGTLSPAGLAQDTLDVTGTVTFAPGSSFVVDVDPMDADADDLLAVTGTATIQAGARLRIRPAPGDYPDAMAGGATATVLDAAMLADGTQFDLGEEFAFLTRDVVYDVGTGSVAVTLTRNAENAASFANTANQRAVGGALAELESSVDPEIETLFDNLLTLSVSEAGPALDALSGEALSASTTTRLAIAGRFQRTLQRRMRRVLFESERAWPAASDPSTGRAPGRPTGRVDVAAPPRYDEAGVGGWLDGFGILGELEGDANAGDVDYDLFGGTAGADFRIGDRGLAGFAAGYAYTDFEVDDRHSDGNADTVQGALYAAWATSRVYAGLSGRYAFSQSETEREIDIGTISTRARGDFDSHDYGVRGEVVVNAFEASNVAFQPLAGFDWSHLGRESFEETGAGSLALDVDSESLDSAVLQLGGRVQSLFDVGEEAVLAPELRAFWLHEFGDREREIEAALGGAAFVVRGAEAPRDGALVGLGWTMSIGDSVRASADYDARWDADRLEHMANVSLHLRF